jgi:hypothetical protein
MENYFSNVYVLYMQVFPFSIRIEIAFSASTRYQESFTSRSMLFALGLALLQQIS